MSICKISGQSKRISPHCSEENLQVPEGCSHYPKYSGFDLKGYSDSDYAGCNMDRKSTSSACQLLGGKSVCWSAKKQQSMATFSDEAEHVVVVQTYSE
ncbi:hypothetical protein Tco_0441551 [Tanacetum coccineum]